jgi:hypothetical protein
VEGLRQRSRACGSDRSRRGIRGYSGRRTLMLHSRISELPCSLSMRAQLY